MVVGIIIACIAGIAACCYGFRFLRAHLNKCEREAKATSVSTPGRAQPSTASCSATVSAAQTEAQAVQHAEGSTGTDVTDKASAVPANEKQEKNSQPSDPTDPPAPCFAQA